MVSFMKEKLKEIEYWKSHYYNWKGSGLSQIHYCNTNKISISCFRQWRTRLHKDGHIKLSRGQKELVTFKPVVPDPEDITTVATAVSAEKDSQNQVKTEIELKLPGNVQLIMRSYQS